MLAYNNKFSSLKIKRVKMGMNHFSLCLNFALFNVFLGFEVDFPTSIDIFEVKYLNEMKISNVQSHINDIL